MDHKTEETVVEQTDTKTNNDVSNALPWAEYAITMLIGLLASVVVLLGYHYFVASGTKQNLGTIDIAEVMQIKELQLTIAVSKKDTSDIDRAAAFDSIKQFAKQLEEAVESVQTECGCVLLVKAAVVKGLPDHTANLKKKLAMDGVNLEGLVATLRSQGSEVPPHRQPEALGSKK